MRTNISEGDLLLKKNGEFGIAKRVYQDNHWSNDVFVEVFDPIKFRMFRGLEGIFYFDTYPLENVKMNFGKLTVEEAVENYPEFVI